jgi:hypothetical protein
MSLLWFLLTKINLSNFLNCKWHFLRLVRILVNENILLISIWYPTILNICLAQKPTIKHAFMFFLPLQWALDVFNIHLIMPRIKNSLLTNYVVGSLALVVISKISKLLSSSTFVQQHPFQVQPMDANDNNI